MKKYIRFILASFILVSSTAVFARYPLRTNPYKELSLGSIQPQGWLLEMLQRQRAGMSSQLDSLYPEVMGARNGWLGGDGDQWERGPYWIDGLLPLAYILNDEALKEKVQPWIEWALKSQRSDGFFGPAKDYPTKEAGLQRTNSADWWPRIVVLKFMKQYYMATKDQRILTFMSKYFQYQLKTLPTKPLDHWTSWAKFRAGDNLELVYWLYNRTGEKDLLALGKLIHQQSYDYVNMFLKSDDLTRINTIHGVNLAQGIKEPIIYYQQDQNIKYVDAVKKALKDLQQFQGQPQGMFSSDEAIHGNNPTQGTELCTVVELMFSMEQMAQITGDVQFMDHLEKIAFNALPTQISADFMTRQYFQQANQVMITKTQRNFDINDGETDLVYGLLTGYPCCTANFHQGWPKFTQNLWYATADQGLAALIYSPSEVHTTIHDVKVSMKEETAYPMDDVIKFICKLPSNNQKEVSFPFHLRVPAWCKEATVSINGLFYKHYSNNSIAIIDRVWKDGDVVKLKLPMHIATKNWYENATSIERGPLVYALKIKDRWKKHTINKDQKVYGKYYYEVFPESKWNYGLMDFKDQLLDSAFEVTIDKNKISSTYPWCLENTPITIKARAKEIPSWKLYQESAGPTPYSRMIFQPGTKNIPEETITLIPYGCTTLRISEFPIIDPSH